MDLVEYGAMSGSDNPGLMSTQSVNPGASGNRRRGELSSRPGGFSERLGEIRHRFGLGRGRLAALEAYQ